MYLSFVLLNVCIDLSPALTLPRSTSSYHPLTRPPPLSISLRNTSLDVNAEMRAHHWPRVDTHLPISGTSKLFTITQYGPPSSYPDWYGESVVYSLVKIHNHIYNDRPPLSDNPITFREDYVRLHIVFMEEGLTITKNNLMNVLDILRCGTVRNGPREIMHAEIGRQEGGRWRVDAALNLELEM